MKPIKAETPTGRPSARHPKPLGEQQGVAEKASRSPANVKARVESQNMPDKPPLHLQHMPNSSGRK